MDFRGLRASAAAFVEREIRPHAAEWEAAGQFPRELYRIAGDAGFLGVRYEERWGGSGLDIKSGRDLSEYSISGLDYANGRLYVLTETYNTIFVVDPARGVERVVGVEGGGQLAAIAIADGRAYMPVDHNWDEDRPPLFVADL